MSPYEQLKINPKDKHDAKEELICSWEAPFCLYNLFPVKLFSLAGGAIPT
jgi:hypothetical protein